MKRGTKCIAQTINLSNPETCIRPKRIQKLVAADTMHPCPNTGPTSSSYWTPRPVAVKVCTWKDMQRTCPPKLCDCPPKTKVTALQQFGRFLMVLLKSSVAVGLVYWTHSEGLWGSSSDVEDLYYRILATVSSETIPNDCESVDLPRIGSVKYSIISQYNRVVFTVIKTIVNGSLSLQQRFSELLQSRDEIEEKPSESLTKQVPPKDKAPKKDSI